MRTWSADAALMLRRLLDDVDDARARLRAAQAADWVSVAATGYREELEAQHRALDSVSRRIEIARIRVLTHTNAADDLTRADAYLGVRG